MSNLIRTLEQDVERAFETLFLWATTTPLAAPASTEVTDPETGTPTTVVAPALTITQQVSHLILQKNNTYPPLLMVDDYSNPSKGVTIHKIDHATADKIAGFILAAFPATETLPYYLATLAIEAVFDPACENGNLAGSNPTGSPGGYDVGIAQMKLKYLVGGAIPDIDAARVIALDPARAIPAFAAKMTVCLNLADHDIQILPKPESDNPKLTNRYYAATGIYQAGASGWSNYTTHYSPGTDVHCDTVVALERAFASALSLPSVFTGL